MVDLYQTENGQTPFPVQNFRSYWTVYTTAIGGSALYSKLHFDGSPVYTGLREKKHAFLTSRDWKFRKVQSKFHPHFTLHISLFKE